MHIIAYILPYLLVLAWLRIRPGVKNPKVHDRPVTISVVVPFRNEEKRIHSLLQTIPLSEQHQWIFVDDHSEDATGRMIEDFIISKRIDGVVLENQGEGKKAAVTCGVEASENEWILQLDADVTLDEGHLDRISRIATGDMMVLPLKFDLPIGFWSALDFAEMNALETLKRSGSGVGKAEIANGAHLMYRRDAFIEMSPFENDRLSSGDDMFLLQKMKEAGRKVVVVPNGELAVATRLTLGLAPLVQQRLRWLSKVSVQSTPWSDLMFLLLFSLKMIAVFGAAVMSYQWGWSWGMMAAGVIITTEVVCIHPDLRRLGPAYLMSYPIVSVVQPMWHIIIPILARVIRPRWKGRLVRK